MVEYVLQFECLTWHSKYWTDSTICMLFYRWLIAAKASLDRTWPWRQWQWAFACSLIHDISSGCVYKIICNKNGILLPKLFWPTVRKNCSIDWEKLLKFEAEGRDFSNFLRSRTIHSNSERSVQFWVKKCFFNLFLDVSLI